MDQIISYFPELSEAQQAMFGQLTELYTHWNQQINVISRKDIDSLTTRHVLHSLAIAKYLDFQPNTHVLDVGTGGGFPGIPLAIMFPECSFKLVDSIGKKIKVVNEISMALGLKNCEAEQCRAEKVKGKFDFVVSRAVAPAPKIIAWTKSRFIQKSTNSIPNGYIFLKGGDLDEELKDFTDICETVPINKHFNEDFFETKKIIYIPVQPLIKKTVSNK
ncbi:MAG: 16S rRNA (guanine(527)-N(7))-methyltransferase RsmG [Bacteroidales bacterium]|nr:16S rRNA (guanine(527)-N(7))-methyltransferase RsmG [Bacteroidales bacterium]